MAETALECGVLDSEWTGRNGVCQVWPRRAGCPLPSLGFSPLTFRLSLTCQGENQDAGRSGDTRPSTRASEVKTPVVHVVLILRRRLVGVADVGPGEGGAEGAEGDGYPG